MITPAGAVVGLSGVYGATLMLRPKNNFSSRVVGGLSAAAAALTPIFAMAASPVGWGFAAAVATPVAGIAAIGLAIWAHRLYKNPPKSFLPKITI